MIKNISESENGFYYLVKITAFFKNVNNHTSNYFKIITEKIFSHAKMLYKNSESDEDKQKWLDVMENSELFDETSLKNFIYENISVGDDIETVIAEKGRLDLQKRYDVIKGNKMFSECFRKCFQLFKKDKDESNIRNKKAVIAWENICIELQRDFLNNQKSDDFNEFCEEVRRFYSKHTIISGNTIKEMGDCPENDDELRDLYIDRLAVIVLDFVDLRANSTNWDNLKDIFEWNKKSGKNFEKCEKYKLFTSSMEKVYEKSAEYVRQKSYLYLSFADEVNDDKLKEKVWESVDIKDFPYIMEAKYTAKEPYIHAKTYLFEFYEKFTGNISEKIIDFSIKFKNYADLKADVSQFMGLDDVKDNCLTSNIAMTNYYCLSGVLGEKTAHHVIYSNFDGDIPLCAYINITKNEKRAEYIKHIETIQNNTDKYKYMKSFINSVREELLPEKIDESLLDDGEKEQINREIFEYCFKTYVFLEKYVFDENMDEGLRKLDELSEKIKLLEYITDLCVLKSDSDTRLFKRFMNELNYNESLDDTEKERYIEEAYKCASDDDERKKQLEKYADNDIEEQLKYCEDMISVGNIDEGLRVWEKISSKSKVKLFKDIVGIDTSDKLKDRLAKIKNQLDELKKQKEKAEEEAKKINSCSTLEDMHTYMLKGDITFNEMSFKKTKTLLENENISFGEYKTGIYIVKTYGGNYRDVQDYIREKNKAIQQAVKKDILEKNFAKFWFLYADIEGNVEFLRNLWENQLTPYDFEKIEIDTPEKYSKIENDVAAITNDNYNDINVNLFLVYVCFKGYKKNLQNAKYILDILNEQKNKIKSKCETFDNECKANNVDHLKQTLLVILEKCADNIIPKQMEKNNCTLPLIPKQLRGTDDFLFILWFELADIYFNIVGFENSDYFHIEIAEKLEEKLARAKPFFEELANDLAGNHLKAKYENLNVLKFTLTYVLVKWHMTQTAIDSGMNYQRPQDIGLHTAKIEIVFRAYDDNIIKFEAKCDLREHWKKLVKNEKNKKYSDVNWKSRIIKKMKERIENDTSAGNSDKGSGLVSSIVRCNGLSIIQRMGEK